MIYFIRLHDYVKIGFASSDGNFGGRWQSATIWSPYELEIMSVCEGEMSVEKAWHVKWKALSVRGEWFKLTSELREAIRVGSRPWVDSQKCAHCGGAQSATPMGANARVKGGEKRRTAWCKKCAGDSSVNPRWIKHLDRFISCLSCRKLTPQNNLSCKCCAIKIRDDQRTNDSKTHCPEGHPYDMVTKEGWRRCRACWYARTNRAVTVRKNTPCRTCGIGGKTSSKGYCRPCGVIARGEPRSCVSCGEKGHYAKTCRKAA